MNYCVLFILTASSFGCGEIASHLRAVRQTAPPPTPVPIAFFVNNYDPDGTYSYSYKSDNGISVQERRVRKFIKTAAWLTGGAYSYTAPGGQLVVVLWYADESGFHSKQVIRQPENSQNINNSTQLFFGPFNQKVRYDLEGGWEEEFIEWFVNEDGLQEHKERSINLSVFRPIG